MRRLHTATIRAAAAALFLVFSTASAQVAGLYKSEPVRPGARMAALADAAIADADNANSFYWNPALLALFRIPSLSINHHVEEVIHGMSENMNLPLVLRPGEALGIGVSIDHAGYVGEKSSYNFKAMQFGYDLAYGREIVPAFSLGAGIGVRYGHTDVSSLWAVSSTFGIVYNPAPEISYGATLSGVGNTLVYASDRVSTSLSTERLSRRLSAGVTLHFPAASRRTIFTLSAANEKVFGESGIRYKGGLELFPVVPIALRIGYIYTTDWVEARVGLGVESGPLRLDLIYTPSTSTEQESGITMSLLL